MKMKHDIDPELKRLFEKFQEKQEPFIFLHKCNGDVETVISGNTTDLYSLLIYANADNKRFRNLIFEIISDFDNWLKNR